MCSKLKSLKQSRPQVVTTNRPNSIQCCNRVRWAPKQRQQPRRQAHGVSMQTAASSPAVSSVAASAAAGSCGESVRPLSLRTTIRIGRAGCRYHLRSACGQPGRTGTLVRREQSLSIFRETCVMATHSCKCRTSGAVARTLLGSLPTDTPYNPRTGSGSSRGSCPEAHKSS